MYARASGKVNSSKQYILGIRLQIRDLDCETVSKSVTIQINPSNTPLVFSIGRHCKVYWNPQQQLGVALQLKTRVSSYQARHFDVVVEVWPCFVAMSTAEKGQCLAGQSQLLFSSCFCQKQGMMLPSNIT